MPNSFTTQSNTQKTYPSLDGVETGALNYQQDSQATEQSLKDNSAVWTTWLTGPNINISRVEEKKPYQNSQPTKLQEEEKQKAIEEALRIINQAKGEVVFTETASITFTDESNEKKDFSINGEILFNGNTQEILAPKEKVKEVSTQSETNTLAKPEEPNPSSFSSLLENSKNLGQTSITQSFKIFSIFGSFFKDLFGAVTDLVKENAKRPLTQEEQKAKEEREKKEKEKGVNKMKFIEDIKANIANLLGLEQKYRAENKKRLNIEGLDIASVNKFLSGDNGPMRNLDDLNVDSDYHDESTAFGMIQKRKAEQEKASKKQGSLKPPSTGKGAKRGPNVEMNMEKAGSSDNQVTKLVG